MRRGTLGIVEVGRSEANGAEGLVAPARRVAMVTRAARTVYNGLIIGMRLFRVSTLLTSLALLALALLVRLPVFAGTGVWTNAGLNYGVLSLAIDPQHPSTIFAGTHGYGVYKSIDYGASWSACNMAMGAEAVRAIAIDPKSPSTLYGAMNTYGVEKSTDGGATWYFANWPGGTSLAVDIDPQTSSTLYAAISGMMALVKSTDGGRSWVPPNNPLIFSGTSVCALAIDPYAPSTIYAGTMAYGFIFKSTDGGSTWTEADNGLNSSWVFSLAIDPQSPSTIFAGTNNGIFKSTNGGATWIEVNSTGANSLAIDPRVPSTVYAGSYGGGVFKSTDGGTSWSEINTGLTNLAVNALALDPADAMTLYAGTDNGVFSITFGASCSIAIGPSMIPSGTVGVAYSQNLYGSGGAAPYSFAVTNGSLPSGLGLSSGGTLSGTPASSGTYSFTITATDANHCTGSQGYTATISASSTCFTLSAGASPSSGGSVSVNTGQNCSGGYTPGTAISLTANPASGYNFSGWSGSGGTFSSTSSASTTFTISASGASVTANFIASTQAKTAYAIHVNTASAYELVSFNLQNPGALNVIGTTGRFLSGGAFLGNDYSRMYCLDYNNNQLVSVATSNAAVSVIGSCMPLSGEAWTGLTDAGDGTLFASSSGSYSSTLYRIDTQWGTPTVVGTISNAGIIIDIAMSGQGNLYGLDITNDTLVLINQFSAAGTTIGAIGFDANWAQGMCFDRTSNQLYLAAMRKTSSTGGVGELRVCSTASGATTVVGTFQNSWELDSLAITANSSCTAPSITTQPQSQTIASGQTATLAVAASGTSPSYQWYKGSSGDTSYPVGTSASYTTPALTTTTNYWVRVYNSCGSINSNTATITVQTAQPPSIASMVKLGSPFRIVVAGGNLQAGIRVYINGSLWSNTSWKNTGKAVLKGGVSLKSAVPPNTPTQFTFVNPDGGSVTRIWQWP